MADDEELGEIKKFRLDLRHNILKRFDQTSKLEEYILATLLDPRFITKCFKYDKVEEVKRFCKKCFIHSVERKLINF